MVQSKSKPLDRILVRDGRVVLVEEWDWWKSHWWQDWQTRNRLLITSDENGFAFYFGQVDSPCASLRHYERSGWSELARDVILEVIPGEMGHRLVRVLAKDNNTKAELIRLFPSFVIDVLS